MSEKKYGNHETKEIRQEDSFVLGSQSLMNQEDQKNKRTWMTKIHKTKEASQEIRIMED